VDWLLIRPDNGKDEVFFTDKGKPLTTSTIGYMWSDKYWTDHQYEKEEYYDSITPHWCRHHFTTWWAQTNLPADQRKYMRGTRRTSSTKFEERWTCISTNRSKILSRHTGTGFSHCGWRSRSLAVRLLSDPI